MRKLVRVATLAALALGATALTAQAQNAKQFGIVGGVDFSSFTGNGADLTSIGLDKGSLTGFAGGFYAAIPIGTSIMLEPEALYVGKGAKYSISETGFSGDLNFNISYIEVPVLFRYNFQSDGGPYILAGPDVAFNISCSMSGTGDVDLGALDGESCVTVGTAIDIPFDANSVTFGGVVGLGFQRGKLGLEGRYDFDFSQAFKDIGGTSAEVKNAAWEILLRYQFK